MAHTLARELTAGATWDGVGELKERGLVGSAPERRALLREYGLDWARPRGAWTMSNGALASVQATSRSNGSTNMRRRRVKRDFDC